MLRSGLGLKPRQDLAQSWIVSSPASPYFLQDTGEAWTPIGQNDAITWPEFHDLYRRRNSEGATAYVRMLAEHGVTCLRLMLEYSQTGYRYFERKDGSYNPYLVQLWDDVFDLCRRYGLKVLLTPFDTFWMWNKWKAHPYNSCHGGPCRSRNEWLSCMATRQRIKRRLTFVTERWGWDGTIFAWDLWNELHPAHAGDRVDCLADFVADISTHLRETEQRLHGATHLQTVSVFHPVLETHPDLADIVYRHPSLDMVNIHLYEHGTIDDPRNTVAAAVSTGKLIARAIEEATPGRPVLDSEHGPIHTFKDHHRTLPAAFDDEYFRHIQWAHMATGGAGGGMRWPNRNPHSLTPGMRDAQKVMADFLGHIDWKNFARRTLTGNLRLPGHPRVEAFGCADPAQAVLYLLRRDSLDGAGMLDRKAAPISVKVQIPGLQRGGYKITAFDTIRGMREQFEVAQFSNEEGMTVETPLFVGDLALAIAKRS